MAGNHTHPLARLMWERRNEIISDALDESFNVYFLVMDGLGALFKYYILIMGTLSPMQQYFGYDMESLTSHDRNKVTFGMLNSPGLQKLSLDIYITYSL